MKRKLTDISTADIKHFVSNLGETSEESRLYYLSELIIQNALENNCMEVAVQAMNQAHNHNLRSMLISRPEFAGILACLFKMNRAQCFVNACSDELRSSGLLMRI